MNELVFLPAHQLAQMIRDRDITALDLVEAYLSQITEHNAKLNAICTLDAGNARTRAKQADEALNQGDVWGALHGVPITIKDYFETKGLRTTAGYAPLTHYMPGQDATVVQRLREAGAILLGKTNPSDVNGAYQGVNDIFPRVNNPWNLDYTSGGSSSGSAVAIAAGLSALDVGSDVAGSIRQPAHCCGIYGLKPTERRVSLAGHILEVPGMPNCIRQMLVPGPLARSVEDLRLCFTLIAGADPRQPDVPPIPSELAARRTLPTLRIAWSDDFWVAVSTETQRVFRTAIDALISSGGVVEKWSPPDFDWIAAQELYYKMAAHTFRYAQPINWTAAQKSLTFLWRESTQGERSLRKLGGPLRAWKELLQPTFARIFCSLDRARSPNRPTGCGFRSLGRLANSGCGNACFYPSSLTGAPSILTVLPIPMPLPTVRTQCRLI